MKRILLGSFVASIFLATTSFAQIAPQQAVVAQKMEHSVSPVEQKEWMALMKKQALAREAFDEQLKAEREAFLKDHPEMAALVQEQMERGRKLAYKRRAALKSKIVQPTE